MRVLACGDRNWEDYDAIASELSKIDITVLIHGDARGADTLAGLWADKNDIPTDVYPAEWKKYGKSAGPIRNRQMLTEGKPDMVVAFHECIATSRGTRNMIEQATQAGVTVKIISC